MILDHFTHSALTKPIRTDRSGWVNARLVRFCTFALLLATLGCSLPKWRFQKTAVLNLDASKEEIVQHLNTNILGGNGYPGLSSWRSSTVKLHVDGIPVALPASIAVQTPRNFRLLVSHPLSGGQELDIGSNEERFWIWTKENPEVMTASHDDVAIAIEELEMPVHIHPDWLMEVFGVIPLDPDEFVLKRPNVENGYVDLVATRQSPLGQDVERVVRVNLVRGHISEHILRLPGGKVVARARMDKYTTVEGNVQLPLQISLEWPDAQMKMAMEIRNPEVNSPALAKHAPLWTMPNHGKVVDVGALARARREQVAAVKDAATPQTSETQSLPPLAPVRARIRLAESTDPASNSSARTASQSVPAEENDLPEWAR